MGSNHLTQRNEVHLMDFLDEVWVKVKFNIESEMLMEFFGNVGGGEALRGYRKD